MSIADLRSVLGVLGGSMPSPGLDLGVLLSLVGLLLLSLVLGYYAVRLLVAAVRWIAGLEPSQFTVFLLVLGFSLLAVGALAP